MVFTYAAHGNVYFVKYGWEIFDYTSEARTASLGNATSSYGYSSSSSLNNPVFCLDTITHLSITHQARFAGIINSDLLSFQLKRDKRLININLIYEGIGDIPDTRSALFDWGLDGEYGTNDLGEGNGIIDEGERLDQNQINYFSQRKFGINGASIFRYKGIPIGVGVKFLSIILGENNGIGIGLDFGTLKQINRLNLGIVFKNIPSSGLLWDNGTVEATLPSLEMGANYKIDFKKINSLVIYPMTNLNISMSNKHLDSQYFINDISLDMAFGLEISYKEKIMLRVGKDYYQKLTGGIGIKWDDFIIDYAFLPSSINGILANHHLISASFNIDWMFSKIIENRI